VARFTSSLIGSPAVARIGNGARLGLTADQVEVADSDSRWHLVFEALAAELRTALSDLDATVEHVGSTAVPGLAAKPIIDVAVGIRGKIAIDRLIESLEPLGYIYRRDEGANGGQLFVVDAEGKPGQRIAYIHVVATNDPQWSRYLGFRDLLKENPHALLEYEQLKRRLAVEFPNDRIGYTAAKESFIRAVLA
jgi:GrpB-like predicted nucleotidyltransferase (UPF0157 family)